MVGSAAAVIDMVPIVSTRALPALIALETLLDFIPAFPSGLPSDSLARFHPGQGRGCRSDRLHPLALPRNAAAHDLRRSTARPVCSGTPERCGIPPSHGTRR